MDALPVGTGGDSPVPARDWSELPLDALATVFVKLGAMEILMGAGLVCRSWLQAAELPELWRSVDMAHHTAVVDEMLGLGGDVLRAMASVAVDRSGGRLEDFKGWGFVTDELLQYIGDRSPALKSVRLVACGAVSNQGFTQLINQCPLLEDLHLAFCYNLAGEALGIAAMTELRSLTLVVSHITNDELASVLDGCPRLERLELGHCFNIFVDDALRARCAGIDQVAGASTLSRG